MRIACLLPAIFCAASCSTDDVGDAAGDCFTCGGKADTLQIAEGTCEAERLLGLLDYTSQEALDDDARLDARAARGIAEGRPFASLAELDAVPYVGPVAFERLVGYADSLGLLRCGDAEVLTEGEPNTEFLETFLALQDEATGDCLPYGAAYFYDGGLSDEDAAGAVAALREDSGQSVLSIETGPEIEHDLAPFLDSFGFDVDGLETSIGPGNYSVARLTLASDAEWDETMVLHYAESRDVWTVSLSCER
jgi:hypothetical protein